MTGTRESGEHVGPPIDSATADGDGPPSSRNSALVAAGILLSRISGLVRTAVIARYFGVSPVADALQAAMRIPNLLQNLLGEGVLSASFIPVYSRLLAEDREEEAGRVAGAIAGLLAALTGMLAVGGVLFAGPITRTIAVGFSGERLELAITLTRIMFPGVGFLVLSAWCLGVLNSHRRFFLSYVAPVIWNVTQIAVLVVAVVVLLDDGLSATPGSIDDLGPLAVALAWGVLAGGILQFAVQLPAVLRSADGVRLSLNTRLAGVRTAVRAFAPVVAGRGVVQLMTYVDIMLASLLAAGALAALEYATRLALLPVSLFGMSVAASELPALSSLRDADADRIAQRLKPMLARIAFYVIPTMVAFVVLGEPVYALVLPDLAALQVWLVLLGWTIGLLSNTSSRLLQSALYADGDTVTPTRYAIARVVLAAAVGALLMFQFDQFAVTGSGTIVLDGSLPAFAPLPEAARATDQTTLLRLGAVGLAVAAGMSSWVEFALLRRHLARVSGISVRVAGGWFTRTALAGVVAGAACTATQATLASDQASALPDVVAVCISATVLGVSYFGTALALRLPETRELLRALRR